MLNEISRDLTSILNVDQLLKRIGDLLLKVIDYHMFSILLLDATKQKLVHRFSVRFKENVQIKHDIPVGRGLVGAAAQSKKPCLPLMSPATRVISRPTRRRALNFACRLYIRMRSLVFLIWNTRAGAISLKTICAP